VRPRHRLRNLLAGLLWHLGWTHPSRSRRGQLRIVTFHRVLPAGEHRHLALPGLAVTPELLDGCLGFFAQHFTCLSVSAAWERIRSQAALERPLLAVSFDDGRLDGFQFARPLLARHGVPATFFVPAGPVGAAEPLWPDVLAGAARSLLEQARGRGLLRELLGEATEAVPDPALPKWVVQRAKQLGQAARSALLEALRRSAGSPKPLPAWERAMDWEQLRQLAREGHEIGCHSMTHAILREELGADLRQEVTAARQRLQKHLGLEIPSFCYPSGIYDGSTLQEVRRAGYLCAATTRWGANGPHAEPLQLRRFDIEGGRNQRRRSGISVPVLAWRISGLHRGPR